MIVLWILGGVVAAILLLALALAAAGRSVPETHIAASAARYKASPREVFDVIVDIAGWTSWAPSVSSVEELPAQGGNAAWMVRAGRQSMPICLERAERPRRVVTLIDDPKLPYGGRWTWEIGPDGASGSRVVLTEDGFIRPPIFRALAKFVFGYRGHQRKYLRALGQKFGETISRVELVKEP